MYAFETLLYELQLVGQNFDIGLSLNALRPMYGVQCAGTLPIFNQGRLISGIMILWSELMVEEDD